MNASAGPEPEHIGLAASRTAMGKETSERLYLTIAFSDISGSTAIAASMEPELYADLLERIRTICDQVIPRHEGMIVRIDGDGIASLFGYPVPREDSGRRAVEAALDLHHEIASDPLLNIDGAPIQLHTGIHAGIALVRSGDLLRGRFEMLGDATNVAKWLCDAARPGEVVVSDSTTGGEISGFTVESSQQLRLAGRAEPIRIHRVSGRARIRSETRSRHMRTPFVGRRIELTQLAGWARDGAADTPVAAIVGAPGLGKTRLASEVLVQFEAEGHQVHRAHCDGHVGAAPMQPIIQLLESIERAPPAPDPDGAFREDGEGDGPAIGARPGQPADPGQFATRITLRLRSASNVPSIVFIDDWQWADDATRDVIDALAATGGAAIKILVTTREKDTGLDPALAVRAIELPPLDRQDTIAAIGRLLPTPEPRLIARVHEKAGGNPLFIEELCHALAIGDDPLPATDRTAWLDMLIQVRSARLDRDQLRLVRIASVIGNVIPCDLLSKLTAPEDMHVELAALETADFLFTGDAKDTIRFKHGLARDAIYRMIPLAERQAIHRRIVEALAAGDDAGVAPETIAWHHAGAGNFEQAALLAEAAADRALASGALDRAQAQYKAAIDALGSLGASDDRWVRIASLVRRFGQACVVDPSREQLAVLEAASRRALAKADSGSHAWAQYWLGFIYYELGEPRAAISHLLAAERSADAIGDFKLRANIRATLGQAYATACDYGPALELLTEAIAIKRRHQAPGRPSIVLSYSLSCRGFVHADQGRLDDAWRDFDDAVDALAGLEHEMLASVLTLRCAACLWLGQDEEALDLALRSQRIADEARARYIFVNCNALIAYPRWRLSGDAVAIDRIVAATRWLENTGRQQFSSLNFGWLSQAMASLGRHAEAREFAARALARARKGDALGAAMAMRAMAVSSAHGCGRRSIDHYLARARHFADRRDSPHERAANAACGLEVAAILDADPDARRPTIVAKE